MVHSGGNTRVIRPRNRRALITSAASDLFYRRGYSRVGMSDIAEAVGIGPSALYRHFAGKQQLLMRVVLEQLEPFKTILGEFSPEASGIDPGDLDPLVRKLASAALDTRQLGVLWQRESRHLPDSDRDELKEQLRVVATQLARLARAYRPDLTDGAARFRAWCLFSVLTSPSYHRVELPRGQFEGLLRNMVVGVSEQPPGGESTVGAPPESLRLEYRASRRRLLLSAATRLFADYGYAAVTVEDIGAAVGIAGPSVYNHFGSKQELLNTVIIRGTSWLEMELERTLAGTSTVEDALSSLLRTYIGFAQDHRGFVDLLISEVDHMPDLERHRVRQTQHEYVSEWVALLREARPELDQATARVLVQAALTAANDMVRTGTIRDADALGRVGQALMFTTRPHP
jgi:AcrR family transcriptional regulator